MRFTDPRPAAMMVTLGANDRQFLESRDICPHTGLLVLFPSWLSHRVTRIEPDVGADDDETRIAIAFNVHGAEVAEAASPGSSQAAAAPRTRRKASRSKKSK